MATLELALVLLATVLASSVLDQLLPRVSLPLIQICCGVMVAIFAREQIVITLNPELFLVLFIAPLLFHEAREADKRLLWKDRRRLLSYAIGLVVAIVLAVGFSLHALVPAIPLAAAFALGAALGPTDPIAVASVSQQADIPERQQTTLQGESLLNDASGIVSFQFAVAGVVAMVVAGGESATKFEFEDLWTFLLQAIGVFLLEFVGALVAGIVLGYALAKFANKVRSMGLENTRFHVTLELLAPFVAYLLGPVLHVSGIILVVACGITMALVPHDFGPSMARESIVSTSVWQVLTFALNGVVFVLLGTQLPQAFGDVWAEEGIHNADLVIYILVITLVMHGVRFLWTLGSDAISSRRSGEQPSLGMRVRSAALMTFAGSKGAITLAIMFTLPFTVSTASGDVPFPHRDLLIFLSCGVIILSLLMATFFVPLLAPREDDSSKTRERDAEAKAEIFRHVIEGLTARQTPENREALRKVIEQYNDRLERFKEEEDLADESDLALRLKVLEWEEDYVLDLIENDEVDADAGYRYLSRVAQLQSMLERGKNRRVALLQRARRNRTILRKRMNKVRGRKQANHAAATGYILRSIQLRTDIYIIERLKNEMVDSPMQSEKISQLINEYERTVSLLRGPAPSITAITRNAEPDLDAVRLGLRLELDEIQQAYEEGRLSRAAAQRMRENVYLIQLDLEDYV